MKLHITDRRLLTLHHQQRRPMHLEANTLYLADPLEALQRVNKQSVDLVIADPTPFNPPSPVRARGRLKVQRNGRQPERAPRFDPKPFLEEVKRVSKLFNGFFFTTKQLLPHYIAFAQQHGYAWDLLVWEHGYQPHPFAATCDFIVCIWERGAYFNPDFKQQFFDKVKHHPVHKRGGGSGYPAAKPRKLIEELVLQRSFPGALVLDPNAGAGTVPVVCREHGRLFLAFESNPTWYAQAKKNLEKVANPDSVAAALPDPTEQLTLSYG